MAQNNIETAEYIYTTYYNVYSNRELVTMVIEIWFSIININKKYYQFYH